MELYEDTNGRTKVKQTKVAKIIDFFTEIVLATVVAELLTHFRRSHSIDSGSLQFLTRISGRLDTF